MVIVFSKIMGADLKECNLHLALFHADPISPHFSRIRMIARINIKINKNISEL
jgi:hypothetical protein